MSRRSKKLSLAEQIAVLSTPKPAAFHPDQDELESETAAKVNLILKLVLITDRTK